MKTIFKKMYWWLIYTVSNLRFVIISRKEYWDLRDKAAELGKKLTELKILQSKYDFVAQCEKDGCAINDSIIKINDALNSKISELEKIAANYAHKKELAKARRKKYEAKKRLQKKEVAAQVAVLEPDYQAAPMSEVEKFARENLGRKVISKKGGVGGCICGYNLEMCYLIISVKIGKGWELVNSSDVILADHPKSMLYRSIENIDLISK